MTKKTPRSRSVASPTRSATATPIAAAMTMIAGDRQRLGQDRHGVGADPEEGDGRERDVAGRSREQRPGGGEHRIHHDADAERELVAVGDERHRGERRHRHHDQRHLPERRDAHFAALPNSPVGRKRSTPRKIDEVDGERQAGVDQPRGRGLGEAEEQARDQRAEEVADPAHDHHDQRLHGEDHAAATR